MAWSSIYGSKSDINIQQKSHIYLLKFLLGFKSLLNLMPGTQHTNTCFHKNNCAKLVLFYLQLLEIVDQDRETSEKLGPQIQEQV